MKTFTKSIDGGIAGLLALASLIAPNSAVAQPDAEPDAAIVPAEPCLAEPQPSFVLPTTGLAFSLPPEPGAAEAVCPPPVPAQPVRPPSPDIFRMTALRAGATASSQKWEEARFGALADHPGPWNEFLETAASQSGLDLLAAVNLWVNWRVAYRDDIRGDEWTNAGLTLERGFGDCEDIALTKLALLSASGRRSDEMYLVLLRDRAGLDHAVLAVREAGRLYVLDNRNDKIQPAEAIDDYRPVLSFSGPFAWTYGQQLR